MKIYGLTIISSEGDFLKMDENGKTNGWAESKTKLFADKKERLEYAIKELENSFSAYDFEDAKDFNGTELGELREELKTETDTCIQGSDCHTQFEFFTQELEINNISIDTPVGKLFAQTKGVKDEYPGIWITKDDTNPAHIVAIVEYNTSRGKLEASAYQVINLA